MDEIVRWASCGSMLLTGDPTGPPLAPAAVTAGAAAEALAPFGLDAAVLGERAAILGLARQGAVSCGGATRMLQGVDGWLALALPREDDLAAVPALFDGAVPSGPRPMWEEVARAVRVASVWEVQERATLLGLACSVVGGGDAEFRIHRETPTGPAPTRPPRVLDLSALWAGPLCASLLGARGADVTKVEDRLRLDGARRGSPWFYDLLNSGKRCVLLDLTSNTGRRALRQLVDRSDVVISSARSRAIDQLGLDPQEFLSGHGPRTWVAVTAHGWNSDRIGFGDDAAAAGGLVAWGPDDGRPRFVGDAIADPLCGVLAARAALDTWQEGGSAFIDASLAGAVSRVLRPGTTRTAERAGDGWAIGDSVVHAPIARPRPAPAAAPGEHTDSLLAEASRG